MEKQNLVNEFVKSYDKLKIAALSLERNPNDAMDLLHELAELIIAKGEFSEIRNPEAYFRTSLRNIRLNKKKKNKRETIVDPDSIDATHSNFDIDATYMEIIDWINQQLRSSPPEIREAFIKYHIDGYELEDLARELNMPTNTLSQKFSRIRRNLKKESADLYFFLILVTLYHMRMR